MQQASLFEQMADIVRPQPIASIFAPKTREQLLSLIWGKGGNNPATIIMHDDPGHGWLQVPHTAIIALGIHGKISRCSYRDTNFAYLEEDCDLATFMHALGIEPESELNKMFWEICPRSYKENTPIRNKNPYC